MGTGPWEIRMRSVVMVKFYVLCVVGRRTEAIICEARSGLRGGAAPESWPPH